MSTPGAGSDLRRGGTVALVAVGIVGLVLLAAHPTRAQAPAAEQALQQQIAAAVAGDEAAFRAVMQQYAAYKDLVARGRVPASDVAVLDNELWAKSQQVWAEVKRLHPTGLERVDNVGSGAYRSEVSGYKPGKSDTDYIPRGAEAEEAAQDFTRLMQQELGGVNPQTVGMNALPPVDVTSAASLQEAQAHPEKYPTAERIKALERQNWERGTTTTWDAEGRQQFTTTKDYFAQKGLPPPEAPTVTDAFGIHAAEQKFLAQTPPATPAEALTQAVHDSKYLNRAVANATEVGGVTLTPAEQALFQEMQILTNTKNVIPALKGRIDLHNGDVNAAVKEYLEEARALNDTLTQKLFDQHVKLLADLQTKTPAAAAQAEKNLANSLAVLGEGQANSLVNASTAKGALQNLKVSEVLGEATTIRSEAAAGALEAAAEAKRVASLAPTLAAELKLPPGELQALSERIGLLELSPGGRALLKELGEALAKRPVVTTAGGALTALAIYGEIKHVATVAGEKGLAAGSLAAGNAAADWALMAASPAYGALRLMQGVGTFAVDLALLAPMKDFAGRAAYEGGGGFLGEQGFGRGDLAKHYDTEAAALQAAATWFDTKKTTGTFTYLGQADVRAAFLDQVRADYHQSALLKFAQEYTVDPATGVRGEWGFFALVGGGDLTFQNFALRFPTQEKAEQAIDYFLREKYAQVTEPPGIDRREAQQFLKTYLLALWQASQRYNAQLAQAKSEAEQRLASDEADQRRRKEEKKKEEAKKATTGVEAAAERAGVEVSFTLPSEVRAPAAIWGTVSVAELGKPAAGTIHVSMGEGSLAAYRSRGGTPVTLPGGGGCKNPLREVDVPLTQGAVEFFGVPPDRFTPADIPVTVSYGGTTVTRSYRFTPFDPQATFGKTFTIRVVLEVVNGVEKAWTFDFDNTVVQGKRGYRISDGKTNSESDWRFTGSLDGSTVTGTFAGRDVEVMRLDDGSSMATTDTSKGQITLEFARKDSLAFRARGTKDRVVRTTSPDGKVSEFRSSEPVKEGDDPDVACPYNLPFAVIARK